MITKIPIHDVARRRGAHLCEFSSWRVVEHFGEPLHEYRTVRDSLGVLDLSHYGKLRVTGPDRVRYLHNMLSNDIRGLSEGQGCYAALLTRQGHLESDLHCLALPEELWLVCPPAGRSRLVATLQHHIVSDQVVIEDRTERQAIFSLQGPAGLTVLERIFGPRLDDLPPASHRPVHHPSGAWLAAAVDRTGCGGGEIWIAAERAPTLWTTLVESEGILPAGHRCLDWLRTEAGIPWYGVDMDDSSLPMVFGLESAISLNKGCYRGQEIVARITHRGRLDKRLCGLAVDHPEPPPRGAQVWSGGTKLGETTSAVLSPALQKPLALAVLPTDHTRPGMMVEVSHGASRAAATVVTLPLANSSLPHSD